jgi:beta-galactosidase GanA
LWTAAGWRYALFVDDAPYFMLGAQVNNSSGWPAMLPKVWPAMEFLHANTVEIPVYWEQFEPRQGQFDYSVVDTLLTQARAHRCAWSCCGSAPGRTAASTTCRSG